MILWDNVSSHRTAVVVENYMKWGIDLEFLLPVSTKTCQVADLIMNGPIKANGRQMRALRQYNYFQEFAERVRSGETVKWEPPPIPLHEGILMDM